MEKSLEDRFIVSVKVGPKGQITIPSKARQMFDIKEGETLMILGDKNHGLAIVKADAFYNLMGEGK
ncbi:MAG: AbrB/MazE/SpoVT family DNA-binding domain-containing protein [Bacilli bacterium]|nr:AbrB/MazE/SpoVT family DNA-binding domain-containing protein [Bacilli bacterium]